MNKNIGVTSKILDPKGDYEELEMLIKACLTLKIPFTIRYEVESIEEDDIKVYEVINESLKFNVNEAKKLYLSTAKIPMPHGDFSEEAFRDAIENYKVTIGLKCPPDFCNPDI